MMHDDRVSKLVTLMEELKEWNNWSATPWNCVKAKTSRNAKGLENGEMKNTNHHEFDMVRHLWSVRRMLELGERNVPHIH